MIQLLVISSAVLSVIAAVPYIIMTLRGTAKPRPVSWAIWASILAIGAVAAFETQQVPAAIYNTVATAENGVVAVLALRTPMDQRDPPVWVRLLGRRKVKLDLFCVAGAVVGLVLLAVIRAPVLAVVAAMATEFIGYIPTAVNAWRHPRHEPWPVYLLYAAATALVVAAAWLPFIDGRGVPAFTATALPLYLTAADGSVGFIILARRRSSAAAAPTSSVPLPMHQTTAAVSKR